MARLYEESQSGWLTPVEVFAPWYSRALARYVLTSAQKVQQTQPLVVYEVGGGNGTNAKHFLDYIALANPAEYARMQYTILEISETLSRKQVETVGPRHADSGVFTSVCVDATDWRLPAGAGSPVVHDGPCVVLALEVLDNLPHDKVVWDAAARTWSQVVVEERSRAGAASALTEVAEPLTDDLIKRTLRLCYDSPPSWCTPDLPPYRPKGVVVKKPSVLRRATLALVDKLHAVQRNEAQVEQDTWNAAFLPTGV